MQYELHFQVRSESQKAKRNSRVRDGRCKENTEEGNELWEHGR